MTRTEDFESRLQVLETRYAKLPIIEKFLNGIHLRNKTISKAGNSSAVVFVPRFLLGQKVQVILIPETTEILGMRKTIDKKINKISKLIEENKRLKAGEAEKVDEAETKNLEDDEAY